MFTGIALFLILSLVAYLVIFPLVRREKPDPLKSMLEDLDEDFLEKNKEAVFTTINEIEFDYSMKKLSEDDYNQLKNQYRQQALELLHEEDEMELETDASPDSQKETETGLAEEIEQELAALRRQRSESGSE